jgi:multicomponent K+:H+ antiporter subunit D
LMTKVGIYVILRLWTLLFSEEAGESAFFGSAWLMTGGMLTMVFGAIGMLGSQRLTHIAGYAAILSSGTLLAATGFGQNLLTAGLLYYLPSSTMAVAALFLIADVIDRWRSDEADGEPYEDDEAPFLNAELLPNDGFNLDDEEEVLIGRAIPAAAAFMGIAFILCTLVITGLPPLSGFVGKVSMLTALLNPMGLGQSGALAVSAWAWVLLALMITTGLLAMTALVREGIRHFWSSHERGTPSLRVAEGLPIAALLACCTWMTIEAGSVMRYTQRAADALHTPTVYVRSILDAEPKPNPGKDLPTPVGRLVNPSATTSQTMASARNPALTSAKQSTSHDGAALPALHAQEVTP